MHSLFIGKNNRLFFRILMLLAITFILTFANNFPVQAQDPPPKQDGNPPTPQELLNHQQTKTGHNPQSGNLTFLGIPSDVQLKAQNRIQEITNPEAAARDFVDSYGSVFGFNEKTSELTTRNTNDQVIGNNAYVRFQQEFNGIPVVGGELIVQLDGSLNTRAAMGKILPDVQLDLSPTLNAAAAEDIALQRVAQLYGNSFGVKLPEDSFMLESDPELWIYDSAIFGIPGDPITLLIWRLSVITTDESLPVKEAVFIDAHTGHIVLNYNQIDDFLYRTIYDNQNNYNLGLPGTLARSEGEAATGQIDADNAYDFAGFTYDFYNTIHGRDSIDNNGMELRTTVRYCPNSSYCPYENAFWNGYQMVFGQGLITDDIMAHELTHGVTDYASDLQYSYQSGAINEGFSDIWGEFIDQTYTNGTDDDSDAVRWLMGEDSSIGAIRNMANPTAFGDPDKITSSYYYCGTGDNGGVHYNSGVANKAAYLMADGGPFNGYTIAPLGIEKSAHIWYEVQTNLLTSTSGYYDLYYALPQACSNLAGTNNITTSDCEEVSKVVLATEMNIPPCSQTTPDAPEQIAPNGWTTNTSPTFSWHKLDYVTDYQLYITDSNGTPVFDSWYSAAETQCGAIGDTTCAITPNLNLSQGGYLWYVKAKIISSEGAWSAGMSFEVSDSDPIILLVDDDDNYPDVQNYYTTALNDIGVPYSIFNTNDSDNEPTANELSNYEAVIWFTGVNWGGYAGPGEAGEAALSSWLDTGGCLFISSQDYLFDKGVTPFMDNYLGVSTADSDVDQTSVTGNGSAFGSLGNYILNYPFYNYSDMLNPDSDAEVAFIGNVANAAVNKQTSTYQTTFWGFPFETLPDAASRKAAMQTYLDWCGTLAPQPPELVSPSGSISTTTPTFVWNPVSKATGYDFYLTGETSGVIYNAVDTTDFQNASCDQNTCSFTINAPLNIDNYTWYIRSKRSGLGSGSWSSPSYFTIPPGIPSLIEPISDVELSSLSSTFTWTHSNTTQWYRLEVTGSNQGKIIDNWYQSSSTCSTDNCQTAAITLPSDNYSWRVRGWSNNVYGEWTALQTFSIPGPPSPPTLNSPSDNITDPTPTFEWAEINEATSYDIYLSGASSGTIYNTVDTTTLGATCSGTCSFTQATNLAFDNYTWYLRSKRTGIGTGTWSAGKAFTVGPAGTTLSSPAGGGELNTTTPTFEWNDVSDVVWYKLELSKSGAVVSNTWYKDADYCNETTCSVTSAALAAGNYSWRIQTWNTVYGTWSSVETFSIPAPPAAPTLNNPSGNITNTTPTFEWAESTGVTGYDIYLRGNSSGTIYSTVDTSSLGASCNSGTCSFTQVSPLTMDNYTWYLRSKRTGIGVSAWSAGKAFTIGPAGTTASSPSGGGELNTTTPTFEWNDVSDVVWYKLELSKSGAVVSNTWYKDVDYCNGTTCSVTSAALAAGSYSWRIQTWNTVYGPWSSAETFSIPASPAAPTLNNPSGNITNTTPTFEWDDVTNATGYDIYLKSSSGAIYSTVDTSSLGASCSSGTCSFTQTTPLAMDNYTWYLRSKRTGIGVGAWSAGKAFTIGPAGTTVSSPSGGGELNTTTPTFEWDDVSDVVWYKLELSKSGAIVSNTWYKDADYCNGTTCSATSVALAAGSYSWRIQTYNTVYGPWSSAETFSIPAPPAAPTLNNPSGNITDTAPTFEWDEVIDATEYYIYLKSNSGAIYSTVDTSSLGASCSSGICSFTQATPLEMDNYTWYLRSKRTGIGVGAWSAGKAFTVGPAGTTASSPSGSSELNTTTPTFEWDDVSDVVWYKLELSKSGAVVSSTWYKDADYCNGTTCSATSAALAAGSYSWRIQTYNTVYGPWSSAETFSIPAPPAAPTLNNPSSNITDTTPTFEWTESTGATAYDIYLKGTNSGVIYSTIDTSSLGASCSSGNCSFTQATPLAMDNYTWYLRSKRAGIGIGSWSSGGTFTLGPEATNLISPINNNSTSTTAPIFTWTDAQGAQWYHLEIFNNTSTKVVDTWYKDIDICDSTSCSISPKTFSSGTYTWKVQTWASVYGPSSTTESFIVPVPPVAPSLISPSGSVTEPSPTFSWNNVENATGYDFYLTSNNSGVLYSTVDTSTLGSTCADGICTMSLPDTLANDVYTWYIRSKQDGIGNSSWSEAVTFSYPDDWTFLVYLGADNNLEGAGIDDFLEMSSVGSTDHVNIVVQFDRISGYDTNYGDWTSTKRFYITQNMTPTPENAIQDIGEANMGDLNTLIDFVNWGKTHYPANHYAVILWNHGGGWMPEISSIHRPFNEESIETPSGIGWDDTNNSDFLSNVDISNALANITNNGNEKLEFVGFDACLMAMVEVDAHILPYANARAAAENSEPWDGWPYNTILADLVASPNINGTDLANIVATRYYQSYTYAQSQSGVKLDANYNTLITAIDTFAQTMIDNIGTDKTYFEQALAGTQYFDSWYDEYIDLYHFAELVYSNSAVQENVRNAAANVMTSIDTVVTNDQHNPFYYPNAHGITIWFPKTSNSWSSYGPTYVNTQALAVNTQWDEFLNSYWQ